MYLKWLIGNLTFNFMSLHSYIKFFCSPLHLTGLLISFLGTGKLAITLKKQIYNLLRNKRFGIFAPRQTQTNF